MKFGVPAPTQMLYLCEMNLCLLQAIKEAVGHCEQLMGDADEDYRGILKDLVVLYADLEEVLSHTGSNRDREEL